MKKIRDYAYKLIVICLLVIIAISGWQLYKSFQKYYKARIQYNEVIRTAGSGKVKGVYTGELDWQSLLSQNPDIRAWVYLEGTIINYPVVRGSDNSFYLTHMFNKAYNESGSLFIDVNAVDKFEGFNTVIYGHNMKDGSMLATIEKYKKQDFYEKNKQLELITPDAKYHLRVVGFEQVNESSDAYRYSFGGDADKQSLIDFTNKNNLINTTDQASTSDKLVTFSTCLYAIGSSDQRYVLVTKMVPWTEKEQQIAKAKEKEKAVVASLRKGKGGKKSVAKEDSFKDKIKLGYQIFKEALTN